jgi:hypothetical protein
LPAGQVSIQTSGAVASADDVQDAVRLIWSTGIISGGAITVHGESGTVDIAPCDFVTRQGTSHDSPLAVYRDAGITGLQCADFDVSYVYRDYNDGTPMWSVTNSLANINGIDKVIAYAVNRNGTTMKAISAVGMNVDAGRKGRSKDAEFDGFAWRGFWRSVNGASSISSNALNILVGAGKYYWHDTALTHTAFDTTQSGTDESVTFNYAYNRNSWQFQTGQKAINNTQYDNAGTLATLSNNSYRTDWVFVVLSSISAPVLQIIMGNAQYGTYGEAVAAPVPELPPCMDGISVFVGQVIAREGDSTVTVFHAGSVDFSGGAAASNHTALANLAWSTSGHTGTASNIAGFTSDGVADDLTGTEVTALLSAFTGDSGSGGVKGVVPAPAVGDSTKYLKGDGTWSTVSAGGGVSAYTIDSKTAAYTVVAGDLGKILHCSGGSYTVSLTAAATLGAGFYCDIVNTSDTQGDSVTIDPNSSETIDGKTTWVLRRGEGVQIYCTGTAWRAGNRITIRGYADNLAQATTKASASGEAGIAIGGNARSLAINCLSFGNSSTASGTASGAIGLSSSSSAAYSYAIGGSSNASEASAFAIGYLASSNGSNGLAIGSSASVAGTNSTSIGVFASSATAGKIALANGYFAAAADSQLGIYILRRATTDTTATVLTTDAGAPSATNLVTLPNNGGYALRGLVIGRRKRGDGDEAVMFEFSGLVRRGAAAANTAIVGTITPTQTAADANLAACTLTVTADTTNGGVALTVAGIATTNIRWVATVWATECVYA